MEIIKKRIYTVFLLFLAFTAFSQQKQVQTSIDSAKIKIGAQVNLTIKANVKQTDRVNFPEGKNFGQLEVLESYPVDTVKNGTMYELIKKYGLTQFDSGRYTIPRLPVIINNKTIQTDSLSVEVTPVAVDTVRQQMYDIKPVVAAGSKSYWWVYVLVLLALAGIGYGIYWYIRKNKKEPEAVQVYATPIAKAASQLKSLEKKGLIARGEVKDYYSELTNIARTYIEEAIHVPAMESTTSELIEAMRIATGRKKMKLSQETFEQLEKVLRKADMVKFAKSRPMDFEIDEDRSRVENTIVVIDKSLPEEVAEEINHDQLWREQQEKDKKRRRIYITAGSIAIVTILALSFFFGSAVSRAIWGESTRDLLNGQWVTSNYGDPTVKIATPKVLTRLNDPQAKANLPANAKSVQKFSYGDMTGDFYVLLSVTAFTQPAQVEAEAVVNANLVFFEKNYGAKNILVNNEGFENEGGLTGKRAYGSMSIINPNTRKEVKVAYSITAFVQQAGIQEVIILHKADDAEATKITDRIMNSIQIGKAG